MSPGRVRVASCKDDAEAAMVQAVLSAHGIAVHVSGANHAALFGLGAAAIDLAVWVDRADAETAAALIREMREGGEAALADGEIPADDDTPAEQRADVEPALVARADDALLRLGRTKRLVMAVLAGGTLQHGTAHMSTRAWKRGITLATVQGVGWWHLAAGNLATGLAMVIGAVATDLTGAAWEIVRTSRPSLPVARAQRT
ncbi:MAG: DUF2007 domain-containing protein [Kofleriaceae bacterium]